MSRRAVFRYAIAWLVFGVIVATLNWIVDAPLFSPDARAYLSAARDPFHFAAWHPPLLPMAMWGFGKFGLSPFWAITVIGTTFTWLAYVLFDAAGHRWTALAASLYLLLSPTWIMLRASFWAESLFMLLVMAIAFVLTQTTWGAWRWLAAISLWVIAGEARYAALFLLPGLVLALSLVPRSGRWAPDWRAFLAAGVASLVPWAAANMMKTGSPVRQATSTLQCVSLATSFNALPYCHWLPDNALCALDPEHRWLNVDKGDLTSLNNLQFAADSPLTRLMDQQTEAGLCRATNQFLREGLFHHPAAMVAVVLKRVWPFLGPWEMTEQSPSFDGQKTDRAFTRLERWLAAERPIQWIYRVLFLVGLLALCWPRAWTPGVLFFFVGGVSHMVGVAISNPFMVLRYMAVTKAMLLLAVCFLLTSRSQDAARSSS